MRKAWLWALTCAVFMVWMGGEAQAASPLWLSTHAMHWSAKGARPEVFAQGLGIADADGPRGEILIIEDLSQRTAKTNGAFFVLAVDRTRSYTCTVTHDAKTDCLLPDTMDPALAQVLRACAGAKTNEHFRNMAFLNDLLLPSSARAPDFVIHPTVYEDFDECLKHHTRRRCWFDMSWEGAMGGAAVGAGVGATIGGGAGWILGKSPAGAGIGAGVGTAAGALGGLSAGFWAAQLKNTMDHWADGTSGGNGSAGNGGPSGGNGAGNGAGTGGDGAAGEGGDGGNGEAGTKQGTPEAGCVRTTEAGDVSQLDPSGSCGEKP
jgi:hypothetical protein